MYHHYKKERDILLKKIHIEIFKNAVRQILYAAAKCSGRYGNTGCGVFKRRYKIRKIFA